MRLSAHGEYVRESISRRYTSEFVRIIYHGSEEVDRSTAAKLSLSCQTAQSSLVSYPSNKLLAAGGAPAGWREESISLRSPGPHFAAQPPFEVSCVRRTRSSFSLIFPPYADIPVYQVKRFGFILLCCKLWLLPGILSYFQLRII